MATISNVAELVLWDANNRVLRLADGTPDVNPKQAAAKYFRIRWNVTGTKQPFQLLIAVERTGIARAAHRELLDAMAAGTAVGGDGWPVNGRRPQTGQMKRHAVLAAPLPATALVATPGAAAAASAHPASGLGFLDYFDQVYIPQTVRTVKGNTSGQYRSFAVAIDRELVRVTAAGKVAITVAEATTEDLVAALTAAVATGGESRRKKLFIVAGKVFAMAATNSPRLRTDNPMIGVRQNTPKQPLVNLLDGRNPGVQVEDREPTYRDARRDVTFWDVAREVFPHLPEFYVSHCWMRLISGPRPSELSDFVAESFHLDESYAVATNSLTLQTPKYNNGQRIMRSGLKARTVNDQRIIPIPDIPECRAALQAAIDTAAERAATRRAFLLSGRGRPRSPHSDPDTWLASELMFTEQPRVFTTRSGAPFDVTNFENVWKKAVHAAYPDEDDPRRALRFYDLREISGDAMKGAGVSVEETALLLGHSERVHRQNYTERRISEVQRSSKQIAEHLLASQNAEQEGFDNVIPFPTSA